MLEIAFQLLVTFAVAFRILRIEPELPPDVTPDSP
jgi:hypothetical protein